LLVLAFILSATFSISCKRPGFSFDLGQFSALQQP
jgi:hypothetical protein